MALKICKPNIKTTDSNHVKDLIKLLLHYILTSSMCVYRFMCTFRFNFAARQTSFQFLLKRCMMMA